MASVKASENQATVLATLSSTLLFDTFKSSREDEKDSDEESFHLPLLDCDEDLQLDKSNSRSAESEDDILNKFEVGTSQAPEESAEHQNSTNATEETGNTDDTVVNDKGENICENAENHDDVSTETNKQLEDEMPIEQNEEQNNEISAGNSDSLSNGMRIGDDGDISHKNSEQLNNVERELPIGDNEQHDDVKSTVKNDIEIVNGDDKISDSPEQNDELKDKPEEEKQLEILLSASESVSQTRTNETLGVDDEEASSKDLVNNINENIDNDDDQLKMNDHLMDDMSKSKIFEAKNDNEDEANVGGAVHGAVIKVSEEMDGNSLKNELEAVETCQNHKVVEDRFKQAEVTEKVCTMEVEDTEEAMLVDDGDQESANAEKVLQNQLSQNVVADKASCEELSEDIHTEKTPKIGHEPESRKTLGKEHAEGAQAELSEHCKSSRKDDVVKEAEETRPAELPQKSLLGKTTKIKQGMDICEHLEKEHDHDSSCVEKNSTDVDKTEDSSNESEATIMSDPISENKEAAEAPSAEGEPSLKKLDAVSEDKKNEPETKEEDSGDNLLDISVIRDVDEDNATAIAEQVADAQSSDKSDNDELDQEDDKTDDVEDSELDQEADKDENMDFEEEEEEDTTNVCDSVIEDTCDGDALKIDAGEEAVDNKERTETPLSEEDIPLSERLSLKQSDETKKQVANPIGADVDTTLTPETDKIGVHSEPRPVAPTSVPDTVTSINEENITDLISQNKRPLSPVPENGTPSKKIRLSEENRSDEMAEPKTEEPKEIEASQKKKMKALVSFQKYMQNKKIKDKLSRSDLEQLCIQKICEAIIHKTDVGELHQTVKKQEQLIENLRKDIQTLTKQARDLDIVNKKLMNELKNQNSSKKPIVPLKITRSVGLQVKLSMGAEPPRRKSTSTVATSVTPPKTASSPLVNRARNVNVATSAGSNVVRTIVPAPTTVRSPATQTTTPILTKALTTSQQAAQRSPLLVHGSAVSPMKARPIRKSPAMAEAPKVPNSNSHLKQPPNKASAVKPSQPGVIDLTDEDDRVAAHKTGGPVKARTVPITSQQPKVNGAQTKGAVQTKNVVKVGQPGTPPTRTVTGLPQSVRLTPNQMKNGIAIPVSTGSTTQLMYVVQPTSTTNSNSKTLTLLNLPAQQLLTSAMNGSTMSVVSSKSPGAVQVKQLASRKHPAPLPLPPITPVNSSFKPVLPKPHLSIRKTDNGIILQWRMPYNLDLYESIASYQLFAYQETNAPPSTEMWRKVGDVKALALPMACTLTQFADKNKYYFAVRSVDVHKRIGAFSDPEEISL